MPTTRVVERITTTRISPSPPPAPSAATVAAAVAAMAAAWISAGSVGFLAQPLRSALVWVALAVLSVAAWPSRSRLWKQHAGLASAVLAAVVLGAADATVLGVLGVAMVLAVFARLQDGPDRSLLSIVAAAAGVLGVFRLAVTSIPSAWSLADALGATLGKVAGGLAGKPLWIGATFAGLDLLLLMTIVYAGWLRWTVAPRRQRAIGAGMAVLAVHLVYLALLASAADILGLLPERTPDPQDSYLDFYVPPAWHWTEAVAKAVPWNLPLLPAVVYLGIAAAMFRGAEWLPGGPARPVEPPSVPPRIAAIYRFGPLAAAVLLPLLIALAPGSSGLTGCKIVAYDQGYLDWEKPVFDQYGRESAGRYGIVPLLVESLGGRLVRSAELASQELADADVLLLFHPDRMWPEQLRERVWQYVHGGGALLLVAGTSLPEDQLAATINQVLRPTSMEIRFDTAAAAVSYWHRTLQVLPHPAAAGVADHHNRFGRILGPSIAAAWPARPLLVGQYGWSDPGADAALNMSYRFDTGEKLGDLCLAAEQRLGKGTIVVLSDPFCLTNEGLPASFPFTGKLLSYLAHRPGNPQSAWRQALGLLMAALLAGCLVWQPDATRVAAVSAGLAASLVLVQAANSATAVLPGRGGDEGDRSMFSDHVLDAKRSQTDEKWTSPLPPGIPIAYIDGSHLEAYRDDPWGFDDVTGLKLTLMRNGYLPLVAPDLRAERLERAALLISIAPAQAFSEKERRVIREFVERGGIFISMAGAENAGPSQAMLADFGFRVPPPTMLPPPTVTEPRYDRHFRSRYLDAGATGGHDCYVSLHAAWPIECLASDAIPLVADFDNRPVIAARRVGEGKVVVIGDSGFAMNKNLEYIGGQPFAGGYENAHFWRWLLTWLNDRPAWIPPKADDSATAEPEGAERSAEGREVSP